MITVNELTKSFGNQILFDKASFVINPGEKIGLVGRNGHGKSTFFKILTGSEYADEGTINVPKGYNIGMVNQHIEFNKSDVLNEALAEADDADSWEAEKILFGLGFTTRDMQRDPHEFSGGFQVRINLAKALLKKPNLLLLDEPTNYLDLDSIHWLTQFLRNWKNELMLITHDRTFMDSVVSTIIAIHRAQVKKIDGTTDKMYQQIAREEEITEKTRINDEKKRKEIENFINRFRSKARIASRVQSRVKMLEKLGNPEKLSQIEDLEFTFNEAQFTAKTLLSADTIEFSYTTEPMIQNFSLTINKSDRICIIGRNGKGKTTLMKILAGTLTPQNGSVSTHAQTKTGYFEQTNIKTLDPERTIEQEILTASVDGNIQMARNISGAMMFSGDNALKKISVLSGGEKARVMLGKILMQPSNLLLLDEPTNHFDMQSCDSLIEAIDTFSGAVVMITHNEMFLRAIATRLIVFRGGRILLHEGTYDSYLEKYGWEDEVNGIDTVPVKKIDKKKLRKMRSDIITEKNRVLNPLNDQIEILETKIEQMEEEYSLLENELVSASTSGDGEKISELSQKSHFLKEEIENSFVKLEELTVQQDLKTKEYEKKLNELEQ
jgi:ATP-binding cassette subfamily F protein 3